MHKHMQSVTLAKCPKPKSTPHCTFSTVSAPITLASSSRSFAGEIIQRHAGHKVGIYEVLMLS